MTRTALLAMDLQISHLDQLPEDYPARAAAALATARDSAIPIIHVALRLRPNHVDAHPRNRVFGRLPAGAFTEDDPGAAIHPDLGPLGDEIVVHKNRVSAFSGNNLTQILATHGIDDLVLAGIATGGVVLNTALHAADLDYRITLLSDACADPNPDLHDTLMNTVFTRRGDVITTSDWAAHLAVTA